MSKLLLGLIASAALASSQADATLLVPDAANQTTIEVTADLAALGLTIGTVGDARVVGEGADAVLVLPITNDLSVGSATVQGAAAVAAPVRHDGSGLSMTTADGVMASLTDLILNSETGIVSGLVTVEGYLEDGDVLYGRMDLFSISEADDPLAFDMIVSGMMGQTLATYLGMDMSSEAFARAVVSPLETPVPGALVLFGTAALGGAALKRRARR